MISNADARNIMYEEGRRQAQDLQSRAADMDGTALYAEDGIIPEFKEATKVINMLNRPIGFVCKSTEGRVVRLLQNYDSSVYIQEPEELPAQFGFVWSTDPRKALPFIALSTSPYGVDECCTELEGVYSSIIPDNVFAPSAYPAGWKYLGLVSEIMGGS